MEMANGRAEVGAPDEIQVVTFKLGEEEYAVDILSVQEINKLLNITRVPKAQSYIEGVINLRGNVIPILNLYKRFGLGTQGHTDDARIIVLQHNDIRAGVIVDQVSEVSRLKTSEIEEASKIYSSINSELIQGVGKMNGRLVILLNLHNLLQV